MDTHVFVRKAPRIVQALMDRYHLKDFQAAGPVGNMGRECGGFLSLREIGQSAGHGGYGWCQWTGPRARDFLSYCAARKIDWHLDDANLGFLCRELNGPYQSTVVKLSACNSVEEAVKAFEQYYERAGVVAMDDRIWWGRLALKAYRGEHSPIPMA
jgi:hypothetical protein